MPALVVAGGDPGDLRAVPVGGGFRVSPGNPEGWSLELKVTRAGMPGAIGSSPLETESWLVHRADGIVHGLSVLARADSGPEFEPLAIEVTFSGDLAPKFSEDAQLVEFYSRGAAVLRYGPLRAVDADGIDVPVRMEPSGETGLRLVLERTSGTLPWTVESLLQSARQNAGALASPEAAPANDTCAGAHSIPGEGPFPHLTPLFDLAEATTTGDPAVRPSCAYPLSAVTRSVWFAFTPTERDTYTFATCADVGTGTTVDDPVMAVYEADSLPCGAPFTEVACDDDGCDQEQFQPSVSAELTAGTTYYVVVWNSGPAPTSGNTSIALLVSRPAAPPPNDACEGAYVVPPAGPFPVLTTTTADITGATSTGDPPPPSCLLSGFTASRSVWYTFTPTETATYAISSCASDLGGTATTVNDTLIGVYTSSGSCTGTFTEVPTTGTSDGCDDDTCGFESFQAVVTTSLTAGTPYFIVVYKVGAAAPAPGNTAVQLRIDRIETPTNDRCEDAIPVAVDAPVAGSTEFAFHDYVVSESDCFSGVGQATSSALGPDVVYEFTAPDSGSYSFKVTGYSTSNDLVLYVGSDCPSEPLPVTCLAGANRHTSRSSEEVPCLLLEEGATVRIYVDEARASSGSRFALEVNLCTEESEPNDTTAQAGALACGLEGTASPSADVDFFALGNYPAGTRLFALVDGVAANTTDLDLRVTDASDTLEYDDLNADVPFGALSPTCDGTALPTSPTFLRVSMFLSTQVAEPYRLYSVVQPPAGAAESETEPNDSTAQATPLASGYIAGSLSGPSPSTDVDLYPLDAEAADLIFLGLDADPERGTPLNARLSLLDLGGAVLATVDDGDGASSTELEEEDSLTATTPRSPGEGLTWRAAYTGRYFARVEAGGALNTARSGDYLLSISLNCRSVADDVDGDGVGSADDCAPADTTAFAIPGEVADLSLGSDKMTLSWTAAGGGSGTIHDGLRGIVGSLPVGPGGGDETCVEDLPAPTWSDPTNPPGLTGFWYLVRGANACGPGTYGNQGVNGSPGTPRATSTCP